MEARIRDLISIFQKNKVAFKNMSNSEFPLPQEKLKKLTWVGISVGAGLLETSYINEIFDSNK